MSSGKKRARPARKSAAKSRPTKNRPQNPLCRKIASLLKSGAESEAVLAGFATEARSILGLDGLCLWYRTGQADFRLFFTSKDLSQWFDNLPPGQFGLQEFINEPNKQALNLSGQLMAEARVFCEKFSLKPNYLAAFALAKAGQNLLLCSLVSEKKQIASEKFELARSTAAELMLVADNARLEKLNAKENEETRTILEISRILNSTLNPKVVRTRAMGAVVRLLDCEAGSLYLIDEAKQELYFEVALGERGEQVKEIRLKIGEGVAGWVAQTGEAVLVNDVSKDPRWAPKADQKSKWRTRNMVTVPVKAGGKLIGVLQALNKSHDKLFDQHDLGLMQSLADTVAIALENALLHDEQRRAFFETAEALADAIEKRDPYTGGHTMRVRDFSAAIAEQMGMDRELRESLELAAILHDIGKIGIEDRILRKPGKLTDEEFRQMCLHPEHGSSIMGHVKSLEKIVPGMKHHHERLDGKGYPSGLKDSQIPLFARIIAVADTWDAMTSDRPYRPALAEEIAIRELWQSRGKQLDPQIVLAFFRAYKNRKIYSQHRPREAELPANALAVLTSIANENKLEL